MSRGRHATPVEHELVGAGLRCVIRDRVLFADLSLRVCSGESLAVVGPSGSGKTTLLSLLAGLAGPASGHISYDGVAPTELVRRRFALVLQGYGLISLLTASENIQAALRASGLAPALATRLAADSLAEVGLDDLGDHLVEELSGGQQQRVAVARALAMQPDVVLADEPTAEQDQASREMVLERLFGVVARGGILVMATHDPDVTARCTRSLTVSPTTASATDTAHE